MKTIWIITDKENGNLISVWRNKSKAKRYYNNKLSEIVITKWTWNGGYFTANPAEVFTVFMDAIENKRYSDMF